MASPVTIHASHPNSHFFREYPTFHEDFHSRRLKQGVMGPHRSHPYQRERSQSPPRRGIDYRSTRFRDQELARQQAAYSSQPPAPMHPPNHSVPQQLAASTRRPSTSGSNRIAVGHLVESYPSARRSPFQQESQHAPPASSASISPPRSTTDHMENGRTLPGIGSLLGLTPENQAHDHRYQAPPPVTTGFQQPRYQGHSAASSLSSAFSEPTSPNSYGQHSRSPISQQHSIDDRARASMHLPYNRREEQTPSHYEHPHQRSQTLPLMPTHAQQQTPANHNYGPPPPPPPPSGPNAMLPPPPDPYYQSYQSQRPPYVYAPPHPSQLTSNFDRPRIDSAFPGAFDHAVAMPAYGWYPGTHGSSGMARKRRGNLPKEATKTLKEWFSSHHDSPYPSEDEKQELCRTTGLQISQVNNWFINARRRLPREDAKKQVEKKDERDGTVDSTDSDMQVDPEIVAQKPVENGVRYG